MCGGGQRHEGRTCKGRRHSKVQVTALSDSLHDIWALVPHMPQTFGPAFAHTNAHAAVAVAAAAYV